ncbi:MAG: phycobiliprotein lyase [Cyanobacteria bacterium SID2]|nr:phycobiliprotein lyase [Cyanobacteria bacterium SID2]
MDVIEFIEQCTGKWFSQRTSHALPPQELEAGKSDVWIDRLTVDDRDVAERCQKLGISDSDALCAVRTRWEGTVGTSSSQSRGSTILVFVANGDRPNTGRFWRWNPQSSEAVVTGEYVLGTDDALTLVTQTDAFKAEERLWFVSPNFRQRTSVVRETNGTSYASFCSEIRMGGGQTNER